MGLFNEDEVDVIAQWVDYHFKEALLEWQKQFLLEYESFEGWLAGPIRETHVPFESSVGFDWNIYTRQWERNYRDFRVERSQTPTYTVYDEVALPSPVHCWSGRVELCRDRCRDHVLAELLLEGLRAGERANRSFEQSLQRFVVLRFHV